MSNEMIENVAKAITKIAYIGDGSAKQIARAAIKAMREPTDQQRNHYFKLKRESGSTEAYSTFEDGTWEMMIDACLKE